MERGEVDGNCESLDSIVSRRPDWIASGKAIVLFEGGAEPHLKDVPFILDRARNEKERLAIRLLSAGQGFGRPFLAPPDLPADGLAMLRAAFDATMKDAAFAEDVRRQGFELDPKSGQELAALAESIYATPKAIVDKVAKLISPQ